MNTESAVFEVIEHKRVAMTIIPTQIRVTLKIAGEMQHNVIHGGWHEALSFASNSINKNQTQNTKETL